MIHHGFITHQTVNGRDVDTFYKELLTVVGTVPLAMVRKRHASRRGDPLPAILLIHGFGQNRYAWHLPSRSFANHLARAGFDVFNVDLRGHGRSRELGPARMGTLEEYYREDLPAAIDEVRSHIGKDAPLYLVGHSLGGLVSYASAPALGDAIAGIATIGSPFAFGDGSHAVLRGLSFAAKFANRNGLPNIKMSLREVSTALRSIRAIAEMRLYPIPIRGWHRGALEPLVLDEHLRLAFDHVGLGEFTELVSAQLFREGSSETEAFSRLELPLLVIAGTNDDLAPPRSVKKAFDRSRSKEKTYLELPFGHIDLLVGRNAPDTTWRSVTEWARKLATARGFSPDLPTKKSA